MKTLFASLMILASSSAFASEIDRPVRAANDNHQTNEILKNYVLNNLGAVQTKVGQNWVVDASSLKCISIEMRGDEAGSCIITADSKTSADSKALYAVLVGEADENGGMHIRKIEFLKQSN